MARPLSQDLRQRIINAYLEPGAILKSVASRFQVGTATVTRMAAKHRKGVFGSPKDPGSDQKGHCWGRAQAITGVGSGIP